MTLSVAIGSDEQDVINIKNTLSIISSLEDSFSELSKEYDLSLLKDWYEDIYFLLTSSDPFVYYSPTI
jgi:hypothetical protein